MKKTLAVVLSLIMILSCCAALASCSKKTYEIALITDKGNIDDKSFNQGAWEGVVAYAKEKKISHQYYKPADATDADYLKAIDTAVSAGAKVVVTPGYLFEPAVFEAQTRYPDVKFILLDGEPHNADYSQVKTESNVAAVKYAEEESGYLAGYAAVKEGFRKLGFMGGMAVPAVQAFGYGFLQGIEAASKELALEDGSVSVQYHYTGDFAETPKNKATAKAMYSDGVEVIFACGGSVGKSVMAAAEESTDKKVIGVDVDQRYDSTTVITSATKGLAASVQLVLKAIYETNSFATYGGKLTYFNASNDGIGLPTTVLDGSSSNAFDRFKNFTADDYSKVYATVKAGNLGLVRTITVANESGYATEEELVSGLNLVKVAPKVIK